MTNIFDFSAVEYSIFCWGFFLWSTFDDDDYDKKYVKLEAWLYPGENTCGLK